MTQQPPPFIPYSNPADEPKPQSIQVISIIGICLGGLTVLARLGGTAMGIALTSISRNAGTSMAYSFYSVASSLLFAGFGLWLLIAAIGCLNHKEIARRALVAYAVVYPIALLLEIAATVVTMGPMMTKIMSGTATTRSTAPMPTNWIMAFMIVTQIVYALVLMVYPTFVLIYLRSPRVRAVFS